MNRHVRLDIYNFSDASYRFGGEFIESGAWKNPELKLSIKVPAAGSGGNIDPSPPSGDASTNEQFKAILRLVREQAVKNIPLYIIDSYILNPILWKAGQSLCAQSRWR